MRLSRKSPVTRSLFCPHLIEVSAGRYGRVNRYALSISVIVTFGSAEDLEVLTRLRIGDVGHACENISEAGYLRCLRMLSRLKSGDLLVHRRLALLIEGAHLLHELLEVGPDLIQAGLRHAELIHLPLRILLPRIDHVLHRVLRECNSIGTGDDADNRIYSPEAVLQHLGPQK